MIRALPGEFEIVALCGGSNVTALARQVASWRPLYVDCASPTPLLDDAVAAAGARYAPMEEIAVAGDVDIVLVATAGAAGLLPTIRALEAGRPVAIANKEVLVMAGHIVREAMLRGGGELRPIDSEHSAIWQCLWGENDHAIRRILLTASGGAFRDLDQGALDAVTPEQALNHPTWKMGRKITVDSASLMNKGMETIEAMWLFGVSMDQVEVVLHRESVVHSLVEFGDGSVKAQLGVPDMRLPIQCALAYPDRLAVQPAPALDLAAYGSLTFAEPDLARFPCLGLAIEAGRIGGTMPAVMAAADEVAVERFLAGDIRFTGIPAVVEMAMTAHATIADPGLDVVIEADSWARQWARRSPVGAR